MSHTLPGRNTAEIQATINRIENSISSNNSNLEKTLLLSSLLASREQYISGASTCDGKDPSKCKIWLDDVARLSTLSGKACNEVASATSKGPLYRYTQEFVNVGHAWDTIKIKLKERFSDCTNEAVARNKLNNPKEGTNSIHEYTTKFTELAEHAHNIKPSHSGSQILASTFLEGLENPYTRFKLRSKSGNTLDDFFTLAIEEEEKQIIRALDYKDAENCTSKVIEIHAMQSKTCFNCGSSEHFAKNCPKARHMQNNGKKQYNTSYDSG